MATKTYSPFIRSRLKTQVDKTIILSSLLCLIVIIFGCSKADDESTAVLKAYIKNTNQEQELGNKAFVFVPLFSGCHSCAENIIQFAKKHAHLKDITYVLSMSKGKEKDFRSFVESQFQGKLPDNFLSDFNNEALKLDMLFTESKIYYCHESKVFRAVSVTALDINENLKELKQFGESK